jgi:adenylate cyclase
MSDNKRHSIEFWGERTVTVNAGQSILQASLDAGIPHFHACGGKARCSTCRILVLEGMDRLSPINEKEHALRARISIPQDVRLACQTYVIDEPVRVKRIIRDRQDVYLYGCTTDEKGVDKIGTEMELVLFFLDIKEFTPFMERLLPFDVIHITRRLFLLFEEIIGRFKGRIVETAGDGLYAVFGLDSSPEQAAQDAYDASLGILKDLEAFNQAYLTPYFSRAVKVGIGTHVGKVITGTIRLTGQDQLTVMGLPVIVAARLQASTRDLNNSFIASAAFYALLKHQPEAAHTFLDLKGISERQEVYLLGEPF